MYTNPVNANIADFCCKLDNKPQSPAFYQTPASSELLQSVSSEGRNKKTPKRHEYPEGEIRERLQFPIKLLNGQVALEGSSVSICSRPTAENAIPTSFDACSSSARVSNLQKRHLPMSCCHYQPSYPVSPMETTLGFPSPITPEIHAAHCRIPLATKLANTSCEHQQYILENPITEEVEKPIGRKGPQRLSKRQTDLMRTWYNTHLENPYPRKTEKRQVVRETGLPLGQVKHCHESIICALYLPGLRRF